MLTRPARFQAPLFHRGLPNSPADAVRLLSLPRPVVPMPPQREDDFALAA